MLDINFIKNCLSLIENILLSDLPFESEEEKEYFWLLRTKIFNGVERMNDRLLFNLVSYLMDSANKHFSQSKSIPVTIEYVQRDMLVFSQEFKDKIGEANSLFLNLQVLKYRSKLLTLLKDIVLISKDPNYKWKEEKRILILLGILRDAHKKYSTRVSIYDSDYRDMAIQIDATINQVINGAKYWRIDSEIIQTMTLSIMRELSRKNIKENRILIAKEMVDVIGSNGFIY